MEKKLKQTPHIVAFLDFLGASEKMRDPNRNDRFLQEINHIYTFAKLIYKRTKKFRNDRIKIKIFSDNIVIAEEIEDQQKMMSAFVDIEQFSLLLYSNSLLNKNIMRGAISVGDLYMDETFIHGEALLNAYNGESKIASYPRIIIDKNVFNCDSEDILKLYNFPDDEEIICRDQDGEFYLNPFWGITRLAGNDKNEIDEVLDRIRTFILSEYQGQVSKNKRLVFPKYYWLANQFNEYCRHNNHPFSINLDKLTLEGVK